MDIFATCHNKKIWKKIKIKETLSQIIHN